MQGTKKYQVSRFIRQLPSAIGFIDSDFIIIDASDKWLGHFNVQACNAIGQNIIELFPNEKEKLD